MNLEKHLTSSLAVPAGENIFTEFHLHCSIWHDINNYYIHTVLLDGEKSNQKRNLHIEGYDKDVAFQNAVFNFLIIFFSTKVISEQG